MVKKGLIVSVKDSKGASCDTKKSYSKITRKKNNYILATTLKCGKEENTITKKFSLKDCQNCQKKAIEKETKTNKEETNNNNTSQSSNNQAQTNNETTNNR